MSSKIYHYRIKCVTDNKYEYWYLKDSELAPTTCPVNSAHSVDTTSVTIVNTISDNKVKIQEETVDTGGNYLSEAKVICGETGPDSITQQDFTWPFPLSVFGVQLITEEANRGDEIALMVGPDTIIGALTADAPTGATGLNVSQTVVDNTMVGYYIDLFTPPSTIEELGRVISIDKVNNKIYCENTPSANFSASGPTYVRQTVYTIKNFIIGPPGIYQIGSSKIGGSHVPANMVVRTEYKNKSATTKCLSAIIEYLY